MTREEVLRHVREQYGTQPDNPWGETLPGAAVLRQRENRKWYALILPVQREKLGLAGSGTADLLEVKCDPLLASGLRRTPGILPAYHMNKEHWLGILLGGPLPEETIRQLIGLSYELTRQKAGKKPSAAPKRRET